MDVREKLVELLGANTCKHDCCEDCEYCEDEDDYIDYLKNSMADYLISHGVTVQEWISVKDRLPDKDGQYLIFTTQYFTPDHIDEIDHRDGIEISGYYKGFGFLGTNGIYAKYWCELPQPPKGE